MSPFDTKLIEIFIKSKPIMFSLKNHSIHYSKQLGATCLVNPVNSGE